MPDASDLPILYSFRRCPYAMRARLAIHYARQPVALREVVLKHKPAELIKASPKATVPVLVLPNGTVIDESLDIMRWALNQHDPDDWACQEQPNLQAQVEELITANDGPFKQSLDRYKYADRYPEASAETYRAQGEAYLRALEVRLSQHAFVLTDRPTLADYALFPFVRQFAHVDKTWFDVAPYPHLQQWLAHFLTSDHFAAIMPKYPAWQPGDAVTLFSS